MIEENFWKWFLKGLKGSFMWLFKFSWLSHPVFTLVFGMFLGMFGSFWVWYFTSIPWLVIPCIIGGILMVAHSRWKFENLDEEERS